jgi:hypothetical protein
MSEQVYKVGIFTSQVIYIKRSPLTIALTSGTLIKETKRSICNVKFQFLGISEILVGPDNRTLTGHFGKLVHSLIRTLLNKYALKLLSDKIMIINELFRYESITYREIMHIGIDEGNGSWSGAIGEIQNTVSIRCVT